MTAPNIDPRHNKSTHPNTEQETIEAQQSDKIIMYTAITLVAFSVGVGLAINFFAPAYTSKNQVTMIYSGAGIIIFATIGIAAQFLANVPIQHNRPNDAATLQDIAIANQQRGYLQIEPFWIANGDEMVAVRYRYKVSGLTAVTTETGFIRLSIDEPSPEHTRTNPKRFNQPLAAVVIDPQTTDIGYDVAFPPLTAEQRTAWSNGQLVIFLSGEILYRDNFFPITLKHRKFFGWRWNGGRLGPNGSTFSLNGFVRNDEEDER